MLATQQLTAVNCSNSSDQKGATIYTFKDGLRLVNPYPFEFTCFVKKRWFGQPLLTVYAKEMKACTEDYYKRSIEWWKEDEIGGEDCEQKLKEEDQGDI